jgi:hypothetical protein
MTQVFHSSWFFCSSGGSQAMLVNGAKATASALPSLVLDRPGQVPHVNPDRKFHDVCGDNVCPSQLRGLDFLRDPRLFKVGAFVKEILLIAKDHSSL